MARLDVWEMGRLYAGQWVMLDRGWRVLDHGVSLAALQAKHGTAPSGRTFYLAALL